MLEHGTSLSNDVTLSYIFTYGLTCKEYSSGSSRIAASKRSDQSPSLSVLTESLKFQGFLQYHKRKGHVKKGGGGGMKVFAKQTRIAEISVNNDAVSSPSASEEEGEAPIDAQMATKRDESTVDLAIKTKSLVRERHKKEMNAAKKEAAKSGENKKQDATDCIDSVRTRHERELEAIRARDEESLEERTEETEKLSLEDPSLRSEKKSKVQKRREKEAKRLEEREARIREDLEQLGSLSGKAKSKASRNASMPSDTVCMKSVPMDIASSKRSKINSAN